MAFLVVSLNPAVDCEWIVDRFLPIEKNEVLEERRWPGGKGPNVARWLAWLGAKPRLFVPLGGASGRELLAGLRAEKIPTRPFPLTDATRVNVIVTQRQPGPQYRLNPVWPRFRPAEQRGVLAAVHAEMRRAEAVILSGALPKTLPPDTYAKLIHRAHGLGKRVILDCDGEAFRLAAPAGPFLVKPNDAELAQWAGRRLETDADLDAAAWALSETTRNWVLVSLGPRGGRLFHAPSRTRLEEPAPVVQVRNTVGAGDALLAAAVQGMLSGAPPASWLQAGIRTGTQATQVPPGILPPRKEGLVRGRSQARGRRPGGRKAPASGSPRR